VRDAYESRVPHADILGWLGREFSPWHRGRKASHHGEIRTADAPPCRSEIAGPKPEMKRASA